MTFLRNRLPWVTFGLLAGIVLSFFVRSFAASVVSQVHAEAGAATFTGSTASFSATFTQGGNQPIRTAFGPLRLDYKSGPNSWTTGLLIREGDGNVTIGAGITSADFNSASKLRVLGVIESTTGGIKFPDGTTQTSAAAGAGNVPNGAMTYFNAACPTGWSEVTGARGRVVVGVPASGTLAGTVGTALTNLEDRTHTHTGPSHQHDAPINGNMTWKSTGAFGLGSSFTPDSTFNTNAVSNTSPSSAFLTSAAGTGATSATSATMPYVQYRVCQYDGNSGADASTWGASGNNIYSINSGNVGIGTTTPGAKLEVAGNINSSTGALQTAGVTRIANDGVGTLAAGTTIGGIAVCTGAPNSSACLKAVGTGTGSTGNGSIYFLDSSGTARSRFDTVTPNATGGTITYSGGYTIHTFTSSGTFTPGNAGNVEYLVVGGGGGGGGSYYAGGGGAGGFRTATGFAVTAQAYTITVGAGGAGGTNGTPTGIKGSDSVFSSITAEGGGLGSGTGGAGGNGGNGGSGGGASSPGTTGGTATSGQGNNGGGTSASQAGGSGGGKGAVGVAGTNSAGAAGGAGSASSISGSSVTYAGGGGGGVGFVDVVGTGGSGGGGAGGGNTIAAITGTANTGGGGGGAGYGGGSAAIGAGGAGGSGIVIVRYPTYGTLYLGTTNTTSADLAEYYISGDDSITAGDVAAISNVKVQMSNENGKTEEVTSQGVLRKADKPYDSKLIGIISTNPGVIMGSVDGDTGKKDKRMLALSGRVPVKIDPESPPIAVGDFLTSSDKPGLAMKATKQGYVVGRALESWQPASAQGSGGQSRIEAFLSLSYYMGQLTEKGDLRTFTADTIKANTVSTKTLDVGGRDVLKEIDDLKRRLDALEKR